MSGPLQPQSTHRSYLAASALLAAIVAVAHAGTGTETTANHHLHVLFRLAYLVPVVLAAVGAGAIGGAGSALAISLIQSVHILSTWVDLPRENTNQAAFIGVYWLAGVLVGALVDRDRRREHERLREQEQLTRQALVDALSALESALSYRDEATARHGEKVASLAVEIAEHVRLGPARVELLRLAGRVHDLGKIGVRDDVLYKQAELSAGERRHIEAHPDIAADILEAVPGATRVAEIVRAHHEYLDGSGYPRGLCGDEISIEAQILTVADVFCALTEQRTYHPAWSSEAALDLLDSWVPHRVDGAVVQALRAVVCEATPAALAS